MESKNLKKLIAQSLPEALMSMSVGETRIAPDNCGVSTVRKTCTGLKADHNPPQITPPLKHQSIMKASLIRLRAEIAERQRLAGVSLADTILLQRATSDLFTCHALAESISSLLDRIEDCTQQLIEIDARIEACDVLEADEETLLAQLFPL